MGKARRFAFDDRWSFREGLEDPLCEQPRAVVASVRLWWGAPGFPRPSSPLRSLFAGILP